MIPAFTRLSLARQFLIASFPILLVGMLFVGWWVGELIERGVVLRTGGVTSHYVESFVSPILQRLAYAPDLDDAHRSALSALLTETPLGKKIVAFKIWDRNGRVLYSSDRALVGRIFPIGEGLASALDGVVHSEVSHLSEEENVSERGKWPRLIETYAPIHADKKGTVIAAAEFYQTPDELFKVVRAAQWKSWMVVAAAMLVMYLLIFGVVRRGSRLIDAQRQQLTDKVSEITAIASQNGRLHERVRGAALRTAALNERFLRRIAADLHDGPGQDMALALMRFNTIKSTEGQCTLCGAGLGYTLENCNAVYTALQSALTDLRAISLGLQLPEIEPLQSTEIAERSVRDFENKTNARIALTTTGESVDIPLPVKIALYRLIQESLANGFRHGGSTLQRVSVAQHGDQLAITVSDNGAGFEQGAGTATAGHLGLTGMRERVEILGGSFNLQSAPGQGTVIEASLPLQLTGIEYE